MWLAAGRAGHGSVHQPQYNYAVTCTRPLSFLSPFCSNTALLIVLVRATTALFFGGIATIISLTAMCWIVGVYMLLCGVLVGILEAPIVYKNFQVTKPLVDRLSKFKYLHRSALYIVYVRARWHAHLLAGYRID